MNTNPNARCDRCGRPCLGAPTEKPEARAFRKAVKGVCLDCAVVLFLQRLANMYGPGTFGNLPEALRLEHVQEQFAAMMRAANAEAIPDDINWERVIELWSIEPPAKETLF